MKKHIRFLFACGIVMLLSEIWKQYCITFIINEHSYNWWYFPFQLCSIPMYLCLLLPFVSEKTREIFLSFLMTFGLMGGIFTFFDTSGLHYPYAPLTVHSYLWHVLLIIIGITAGLCLGSYKTCRRKFPSGSLKSQNTAGTFSGSILCYLICCIIATVFNIIFHSYGAINMFYISPYYAMEQKVFKNIALFTGNTAGIFIYIAANIAGAYLICLIWRNVIPWISDKTLRYS